jgi:hypothetical protein
VHEVSASPKPWTGIISDEEAYKKKLSNAKKRLCTEFVSKMTPDLLTNVDPQGGLRREIVENGKKK